MPRNVADAEAEIGQFEDEEDFIYDDSFDDDEDYEEDLEDYDDEELEELDGTYSYVDHADFEQD